MKRTALCFLGIIILLYAVVPMTSFATQIFVVKGLVTDGIGNPLDGVEVTVENTSRAVPSKTTRTGEVGNGLYSVVFFSISMTVAEAGDEIKITVEEAGDVLADKTYTLTMEDIDNTIATIDIPLESKIPAPIIDSVASDSGIISGGDIVQLIGENFQEGASVTVGGIEILDVVYISPTEITITIPEDAVGASAIVITNPDGQPSEPLDIQIEPRVPVPILDSVTSDSGIITEGTIVQLLGQNFQEGASVSVGGIEILDVELISPTEITFTIPASMVGDVEIVLTNPDGQSERIAFPYVEFRPEDINRDNQIDIFDIVKVGSSFGQTGEGLAADIDGNGEVDIFDLVRVARLIGQSGIVSASPSAHTAGGRFDYGTARQGVQQVGTHGRTTSIDSDNFRRLRSALTELERKSEAMPEVRIGADLLRNWLATNAGIPAKTQLLPNYPNPFNPETWIPYHLDRDSNAALSIYNASGVLVRHFDLGHQSAGFYTEKGNAIYWDGHNERGEAVASGTYFYQLRAGKYSAVRRMAIVK